MVSKIYSAVPRGVDALPVQVEVDAHNGLPNLIVVGLPDAAVREAKERILASIRHLGCQFDAKSIVINLSPAEERKEGAILDLAMAVGVLTATDHVPSSHPAPWLIGELSLDGTLRPVRGVLPIVETATAMGAAVLLPRDNLAEAAVIRDAYLYPASTLSEVVAHLRGERPIMPCRGGNGHTALTFPNYPFDLADVAGQQQAKRALEVAAAGRHHLLFLGPPGAGKTMLAQRLPTILPPLDEGEALATTKVYSVAPGVPRPDGLLRARPFRSPHHTISSAGLVGGGSIPRPGEISLAHNGVLFLDEITEFRRDVLEVLRQPMESGRVVIARAAGALTFPASFQLVAAANPCPCGHLGDARKECRCSTLEVRRYRSRLSGPLLDRIDLQIEVPPVAYRDLSGGVNGDTSAVVRERVMKARQRQAKRLAGTNRRANAELTAPEVRRFCALDNEGERLIELAMSRLALSARAIHRILRVALTIADLEEADSLATRHLAEAIAYRSLDRAPHP